MVSFNGQLDGISAELRQQICEHASANAEVQRFYASSRIGVLFLDPHLRITRFTPIAKSLLHLIEEDVGRPISALASRQQGGHLPDDASEVLRSGNTVERYFEHGSGQWFMERVLPLLASDGRVEGVIVTLIDITTLKRSAEALRSSEEFNRRIMESSEDCIQVLDIEGRLLSMSPGGQRRLEIPDVSPILHKSWLDSWQNSDREAAALALAQARSGGVGRFQASCRTTTGKPKWWDVVITAILGAQGAPERLLAISRDVTEQRNAEQAVRESERLYRAIGESIDYGVWVCAPDGRNIYASDSFLKLVGITQQQCSDFGWGDVLHPDDADRTIAAWKECVRTGGSWAIEHRFRGVDGEWHPILARGVPVRHEDGTLLCWAGINLDISGLKRAEQAARTAEAAIDKTQRLLNETQRITKLGGWEYDVATRQGIWTDEVYEIYGVSRDAWDPAGAEKGIDFYASADRQKIAEAFRRAVEEGVPYDLELQFTDARSQRKWVRTIGRVERRDGKVARVFGNISDVTERRQAQAALAEHHALLQSLIESSADSIFSVDREFRYTSFNSRHALMMKSLYGKDIELGRRIFDYQGNTDDYVQARKNLERALAGEQFTDSAFSGDETRSRVFIEVTHNPVRNEKGHVIGASVFARDTTARRRAEQQVRDLNAALEQRVLERTAQLEGSNRELEAFSYSVSHDLRAPLRAIDGFTQILLDEHASHLDAEGQRVCSVIRDSTRRMGRLIDDLLAFSRLGRADMQVSSVDMAALAHSIYLELTSAEQRERIELQLGDLPRAVADPTLIRQVWFNLLSNAVKFTSKNNRAVIHVTAESTEREHAFTVQDDGVGFDMQYMSKLFGVFQRLHSSRDYEGTGVGLALVQRIIQRHGGRVWAEGATDHGAAFHFTLPTRKG